MLGSQMISQLSSPSHSPALSESQLDDSFICNPSTSPSRMAKERFHGKYRKDELWASIETNYEYLMDKGIIEACQSQEVELIDGCASTDISFNEFLKQYTEVTEWLKSIQMALQWKKISTTLALSTNYLNQSFYEEMERSPRQKLINEYACQLKTCKPALAEELDVFLNDVNTLWETVHKLVTPTNINMDPQHLIKDLEADLECLKQWLEGIEDHLRTQSSQDWPFEDLEIVLKDHKVLQQDIESHSRVISAILKLSDSIQDSVQDHDLHCEHYSSENAAHILERRWHGIWLQSLEWQCRIEDGITKKKGIFNRGHNFHPGLRYPTSDDEEYEKYNSYDVTSGGEDSFTGVTYRSDFVQSPTKFDSSTFLSSDFDTTSGKDSAVASETEQKTNSDMSENYPDLFIPNGIDSDREVWKLKPDCGDVGYGSESHSDDLEGHAVGITFNNISSKSQKNPTKCVGYYVIVAMDTETTTDKTERCNLTNNEQTGDESSDICMQIQEVPKCEVHKQEVPEMEDIHFLINQADIMVQQGNVFNKIFSPKCATVGKVDAAIESQTESLALSSSGPTKEMVDKGVGTVESSCDASDEESGESDYQPENETEIIGSVIASECNSDEMKYCSNDFTKLPKLYDTNTLIVRMKGQKKDRPWSLVELPNVTEVKQLTTSESAIDKINGTFSDSDMPLNKSKMSQSLAPTFPQHRNPRALCNQCSASYQSKIGTKCKLNLHLDVMPTANTTGTNFAINSILAESDIILWDLTSKCECKDNSNSLWLPSDLNASGSTTVPLGVLYTSEDEVMTSMPCGNDLISTLQNARFKSSGSSLEDTDAQGDPIVVSGIDDGNFSENAWDNYQPTLYTTGSEEPVEDPLSWEPGEMEFDDEFCMPQSTILATLLGQQSEEDLTKSITLPKLMPSSKANIEDSDSDIEDLHHVLEESFTQLKVADKSLKKKRKDPLKTGLYINPRKYDELLATIETNIHCLEAICQHLGSAAVSEDDIETIRGLLYKWEKLHNLAFDRRKQSHEVKTMYTKFISVERTVNESTPQINKKFKCIEDLQTSIDDVQDKLKFLHYQKRILEDLRIAVEAFSSQNTSVNMEYFLSQIQDLALDSLLQSCYEMQSELNHTHSNWLEYKTVKTELEFLLSQDLDLLEKLQSSQKMDVDGCKSKVEEWIKKIFDNLDKYKERVIVLRHLHANLMKLTEDSDDCLDYICSQLFVAKEECDEMMLANSLVGEMIYKDVERDSGIDYKMSVEDVDTFYTEPQKLPLAKPESYTRRQLKPQQNPKSSVIDWLKFFSIQAVTLAVFLGLLYLFSPKTLQRLFNFTLRFTPELNYIDGSPPI